MDFQKVLNSLEPNAKEWASSLSTQQLANLLDSFYELETHKVAELEAKLSTVSTQLVVRSTQSTQPLTTPEPEQYAANIGKFGEQSFADVVRTLPRNYRVYNTAKDGHAGDFVIEYSQHGRVYRCLVDIKTYKSTVPKKEIDKFISDLTYGNYDGGLLVSHKSHFVGHPESICIEDVTVPYATVPVMYLAKIDDDLLNSCIEVICAKMSTLVTIQMDQSTIMTSINFINTSLQQLGVTRRILSEMQSSMTTQIQRCQESLIAGEVQIKMGLKQMKREINRPRIVLPEVPPFTSRDDNIADIPVVAADNLPLVGKIEPDNIEQATDLQEDLEFNYKRFCKKDGPLIRLLTEFDWSNITQDDKGLDATFECPFVNMDVKPLKTKSRVEIFDEDNLSMDVPTEITDLLTRRAKKYIGTLTPELIDVLSKYFSEL